MKKVLNILFILIKIFLKDYDYETSCQVKFYHLQTWEVVDIEEEGEGGKVIKSSIHVPAHPTPSLTQGLAHLCSSASCVAVHTISRYIFLFINNVNTKITRLAHTMLW